MFDFIYKVILGRTGCIIDERAKARGSPRGLEPLAGASSTRFPADVVPHYMYLRTLIFKLCLIHSQCPHVDTLHVPDLIVLVGPV